MATPTVCMTSLRISEIESIMWETEWQHAGVCKTFPISSQLMSLDSYCIHSYQNAQKSETGLATCQHIIGSTPPR